MSDELIEKQLRDTFRKKLYFKKYYIENTEDYKEKSITEESIAKKKAYYELHKEKRKQYQKDRYNAKIKNMNKGQSSRNFVGSNKASKKEYDMSAHI